MEVKMNPNKTVLVLVALAAQWALADAPLPAFSRLTLTRAGSDESAPKPKGQPPPGVASSSGAHRQETVAARSGLLAFNP
jgi:hypothetical protein